MVSVVGTHTTHSQQFSWGKIAFLCPPPPSLSAAAAAAFVHPEEQKIPAFLPTPAPAGIVGGGRHRRGSGVAPYPSSLPSAQTQQRRKETRNASGGRQRRRRRGEGARGRHHPTKPVPPPPPHAATRPLSLQRNPAPSLPGFPPSPSSSSSFFRGPRSSLLCGARPTRSPGRGLGQQRRRGEQGEGDNTYSYSMGGRGSRGKVHKKKGDNQDGLARGRPPNNTSRRVQTRWGSKDSAEFR